YSWKTRLVVAEKKIPCEIVAAPQNRKEDPAFARLNPFKLTPVLELGGGRTLYESSIINEYFEETYPDPPMLPKDPFERARVRLIEDTTDQYLLPASRKFTMAQFEVTPPLLIPLAADKVDHKAVEEGRMEIRAHLARLEAELSGRPYFGGEIFSLADAALIPPLSAGWVMLGILPDEKYPLISGWIRRVKERPSYKVSAPKEPYRIKEA